MLLVADAKDGGHASAGVSDPSPRGATHTHARDNKTQHMQASAFA